MAPTQSGRGIGQYDHKGQTRLNNPPVGLVTPETDKLNGKTHYQYDPHLDPQLVWAGKTEHASFDVPRVSLHVHERIDPLTIIRALRQRSEPGRQKSLFEFSDENPPLREAIEFYKHKHNWSNRLIAGDSLLVMNSLLDKEGLKGKVQMVYIDPPYGIKYGSNFQPFVNKRDVRDGKDEDLCSEPETIKAFRDTWELGIHSYLSYLRDRLLLAKVLLTESGSVFVQISDENLHHVRELIDEVFGQSNFIAQIALAKTSGYATNFLTGICDYLLWYGKNRTQTKYHQIYAKKIAGETGASKYTRIMLTNGTTRTLSSEERLGETALPKGARFWVDDNLTSQGNPLLSFMYKGTTFKGTYKTTVAGLERLALANRLYVAEDTLRYIRFLDDFPAVAYNSAWMDIGGVQSRSDPKVYVVQTATEAVKRCLLMTTDPGDLVLDPTCGSGTTAYVAEQWGRRWITCDTSRVAITIAKQRLMTAVYNYYELADSVDGVGSGFNYKTVPHVTLKSIANNQEIADGMSRSEIDRSIIKHADQEILYDQPNVDASRARVAGPFTIEAVPAPTTQPIHQHEEEQQSGPSLVRSGETLRQSEWRDELHRTGIRGKLGQKLEFSRVEPLPAHRWLNAEAETTGPAPDRVVITFGPEHAPLESRQVALALEEAQRIVPKPTIVVFAAFQFDPEAAKDIDETDWPGVTLLKVQMNPDLFTEDLKKKRASNQSFWLIGQPDVRVSKFREGKDRGKWTLEVSGFDYYNTKTGAVESGGTDKIALWMLDTDYDGRSLFPRQVFLPLAGDKEGWSRVAKTLRGEINEEAAEAFRGTVSLPFEPGKNKRVAVKIIDDRGIESLKVIEVD